MTMEHVEDLIDLEALGALEPEDSAQVRAHIMLCPACRESLMLAQEAAARIALTAPVRHAPFALREGVLAAIEEQPTAAEPVPLMRRWHPLARLSTRWGALAAALVVAPVAGLVTWAVVLQTQVNDLKQGNRQLEETQRNLVLLAVPPSVIKSPLTPSDQADGARGSVSWNPVEGKCAVVVNGLAKLEPGATYQVYYEGMKGIFPAGELKPDEEGNAGLVFDVSKWRGDEYRVWVSAVRPTDHGTVLLSASLRRD